MTPRESTVSWSAARTRADRVRDLTTAALGELAADHLNEALRLGEGALELMASVQARWGCDERAMDSIVSLASLALPIARQGTQEQATRTRSLLDCALRLRLGALIGRDVEVA